jgi:hypothetical protein
MRVFLKQPANSLHAGTLLLKAGTEYILHHPPKWGQMIIRKRLLFYDIFFLLVRKCQHLVGAK